MRTDTIRTVLRRSLTWGAIAGLAVGLACGLVGLSVAGGGGLASGLTGAVLTVLFLGVTAGGVLLMGRMMRGDSVAPFAVLMGAWFVKLVLFLVVMIVLRAQAWVQPYVLFASIVGTVIASLVVDCVVVARARIPVTDRV